MTRLQRRITVALLAGVGGAVIGYVFVPPIFRRTAEPFTFYASPDVAIENAMEDAAMLLALQDWLKRSTVGVG
jgi:hypothetical protein